MARQAEAAAQFKHLFTPLKIGSFTTRNRIVSTAVGTGNFAITRAKGGIGLIITGSMNVSPTFNAAGNPTPSMMPGPLWTDDCIAPMKQVADAVHQYGARYVAQLNHSGRNTYGMTPSDPVWSSSASVNRHAVHLEVPHEMTVEEIQYVVEAFGAGARRMREAGLDGVEIHASHDYLIPQFMSPLSNKRDDEYGGSEDNRLRFAHEVIDSVRAAVGADFTVGIRIDVDRFEEGDNNQEDAERILRKLTASDKLDYVSATLHFASNETFGQLGVSIPTMYAEPGKYVYLAAGLKQVTDLPVFAVGRITSPIMAEQVLASNEADMVAMLRANIADPEISNKAREGRLDEINYCIGCNEGCLNSRMAGGSCAINPMVGREAMVQITPAETKKKVMVIGGGIAGMESARVAAMRGHQVTLYEKAPVLGGQLQTAAKAPGRSDMAEPARYYTRQFELLEVPVHLGTAVDEALVKKEAPDAVIVATGGKPATLPIEGVVDGKAAGVNVVLARDVLAGTAEVKGEKVAVFATDQDMEGLTTADFLADRRKQVEMLIPYPNMAAKVGPMVTLPTIVGELTRKGVTLSIMTAVKAIRNGAIIVHSPPAGPERTLEGVTDLVISAGSLPNDALWKAIRKEVKEIYNVGESFSPRRLQRSSTDGLWAGLKV
jgi:2,4-dienoyl-CoA reductase-like NADH-dependent reductase (Old Yellow Enzyme family)/thioredoxin reductase